MDDLEGYVSDDELAIGPLNALGWEVSSVSWRDNNVDWDKFNAVVIRTTWDYHLAPDKFVDALQKIDASTARLENALSTVKWNLNKTYLRDLENKGVTIVPTIWRSGIFTIDDLERWKRELKSDEIILKPTISATARDTFRIKDIDRNIMEIFAERSFMIQPFMSSITEEGEFSLFYFNGEYSHAILKRPKNKDFRVQEEHGGIISAVTPEADMLKMAEMINGKIDPLPLYSRIDLVRHDGGFALMELELIEPALYFRTDPNAAEFFARQLDKRMSQQ